MRHSQQGQRQPLPAGGAGMGLGSEQAEVGQASCMGQVGSGGSGGRGGGAGRGGSGGLRQILGRL